MRILPLLSAAVIAAFACGCEAEPPPRAPVHGGARASADDVEVTRDIAVRTAQADASFRFREIGGIAFVNAHQLGRFWVVELHASNGHELRYAISRNDGTIRQRSMIR